MFTFLNETSVSNVFRWAKVFIVYMCFKCAKVFIERLKLRFYRN